MSFFNSFIETEVIKSNRYVFRLLTSKYWTQFIYISIYFIDLSFKRSKIDICIPVRLEKVQYIFIQISLLKLRDLKITFKR